MTWNNIKNPLSDFATPQWLSPRLLPLSLLEDWVDEIALKVKKEDIVVSPVVELLSVDWMIFCMNSMIPLITIRICKLVLHFAIGSLPALGCFWYVCRRLMQVACLLNLFKRIWFYEGLSSCSSLRICEAFSRLGPSELWTFPCDAGKHWSCRLLICDIEVEQVLSANWTPLQKMEGLADS